MKEYRRIQKTGESTCIISLPKRWAELNGVDRGTEASIRENDDGSLTISVRKDEIQAPASISSTADIDRTLQKIIAAYLAGHGKISVKGRDSATVCEEARARLSGLEILEEGVDEAVLAVLPHDDFSIDDILRRAHKVGLAMFSLLERSIDGERGLGKEAARREQEMDRLFVLGLRTLNTQSTKTSVAVYKAFAIKTVERVSDHIERAYLNLPEGCEDRHLASQASELRSLYGEIFENMIRMRNPDSSLSKVSDYRKRVALALRKERSTRKVLEHFLRISEYLVDLVEITEDLVAVKGAVG
ncbi:MAG: hypothetical protein ACP5NX_01850 [Candidatus Bilamarchaeaceae archaeon]